jgi:hypothetical protein
VHIGGKFSRIATAHLLAAASINEEVAGLVGVSREWMLLQAQQLVACAAVHTAAQRVCRWLLSCHQRMETATIPSTQEQIAALLGIRRTTVTLVAQSLHEKGIIEYRRGKIMITDPAKLKSWLANAAASWPRPLAASAFGRVALEKPNKVQTTEAGE